MSTGTENLPRTTHFPLTDSPLPDVSDFHRLIGAAPGVISNESGADVIGTVDYLLKRFSSGKSGSTCALLPPTPLYRYELMDQALPADLYFKFDNLQRFGDIQARAFAAIVLLNHRQARVEGRAEGDVPERIVISAEPGNYSSQRFLQEITCVARHLGCEVDIYASTQCLTQWLVMQLYNCHHVGASLHWIRAEEGAQQSDVSAAIRAAAKQGAEEKHAVLINPVYDRVYGLLGIATAAAEMFERQPELDHVVVPVRECSSGWTTVAGVALYCAELTLRRAHVREALLADGKQEEAARSPGPITVSAAVCSELHEGPEQTQRWLENRSQELSRKAVFETWDIDGNGYLERSEMASVLTELHVPTGKRAERVALPQEEVDPEVRNPALTVPLDALHPEQPAASADLEHLITWLGEEPAAGAARGLESRFSFQCFSQELDRELLALEDEAHHAFPAFHSAVSLPGLRYHGLVRETVPVSASDCEQAFLVLLQYTHTHANGRAASAVAAVLSGNLSLEGDRRVGIVVSGGTVDAVSLDKLLAHSLRQQGQLIELQVCLPSDTNSLAELLSLTKQCGCSVLKVTNIGSEHGAVRLGLTTPSIEAAHDLEQRIMERGWTVNPLLTQVDVAAHQGWRGLGPSAAQDTSLGPLRLYPATITSTSERAAAHGLKLGPDGLAIRDSPAYVSDLHCINDITPQSIEAAAERLRASGSIWPTMVYHSSHYSRMCGCEIYLQLENTQKTGSFKIRGSTNMLLKAVESGQRPTGVIACSAGNHAQGVAYTCARLGIPCCIVCPSYAPATKLSATRRYGAEVVAIGQSFEEAAAHAQRLTEERGWLLLHPYAALDVIEGQGTIAADLVQVVPDVDTVLVNVGGGGMISGIALYLKKRAHALGRKVRIVGLQAETVAPLVGSEASGELHYVPPTANTLADGVNVKLPGSAVHDEVLFGLVDEYISVPENEIAATITHALIHTRTLTEGAGVLGVAALLYGRVKVRPDEKVAVVMCGGNVDIQRLRQITEFGFRALGRALTVDVKVEDKPGALLGVVESAAASTVSIRHMHHARASGSTQWTDAVVSLDAWTSGFLNQNRFLARLVNRGLEPAVVGRSAIPHEAVAYRLFDELLHDTRAAKARREAEAQEAFKEAERQRHQRRVKTAFTLTDCGDLRPLEGAE